MARRPTPEPPAAAPDDAAAAPLPPATERERRLLGTLAVAAGVVAVVLTAGGAPPPLRTPFVLVAATLLPGYAVVARLRVDLPTLLALDVCASLALDTACAFLMVRSSFWHPQALGLALAGVGVGSALAVLSGLRSRV